MAIATAAWRGGEAAAWACAWAWAIGVASRRQWRLAAARGPRRAQLAARLRRDASQPQHAETRRASASTRCFERARSLTRAAWSLQLSLLASLAILAALKAWTDLTNGVLRSSWLCGSETPRSAVLCLPRLDVRRWDAALDAIFVLASSLMLAHLVRSSVQLRPWPSLRLGLVGCVGLTALACAVAVLVVPLPRLEDASSLPLGVRTVLATESALLSLVLLWTYYNLWRASLSVPIHMSLLRDMTRRITVLVLILTLGWIAFGATQLWLAGTGHALLSDVLSPSLCVLLDIVGRLLPTCAMLHFHTRPPVVSRARARASAAGLRVVAPEARVQHDVAGVISPPSSAAAVSTAELMASPDRFLALTAPDGNLTDGELGVSVETDETTARRRALAQPLLG